MNSAMKRTIRMGAYALAFTLMIAGIALARDDDDGYYRQGNPAQARTYGYQNGFRDSVRHGREEGREHDPGDYQTPDWRQATSGYQDWMGPLDQYQRGYRDGYRNGFREGYRNVGWNDGDRDDRRHDWRRDDDVAYRFGYEDGAEMARSDLEHGKRFNSKPRGRYDDRDRGYRPEYGDKKRYKAEYTQGYRAGYSDNYRY